MLYIYTEQFLFKNRLKAAVKKLLGRYTRGPQAVERSLIQGLKELGVSFLVNQAPSSQGSVCGVLSGVGVLSWAIEQKKKGVFDKLIAGPNIVVSPQDSGGLLSDEVVDTVLVPSQWVEDVYVNESPRLKGRVAVWPAGVQLSELNETGKILDFLIYDKTDNAELRERIIGHLSANKYNYAVFKYGTFGQQDYFFALSKSKNLIYLSATESQGLAMVEAWIRNVPVLAWEPGEIMRRGAVWYGVVATPYVDESCGRRFRDFAEFQFVLPEFVDSNFKPRQYALRHFTDRVCAQNYLNIVNNAKSIR